MRSFVALLAILLLAAPARSQDDMPQVTVELSATETIPGQPLSLRLTVLVPSFMPQAPNYPSFEAPNLMVRLGSSGPISRRIDGETWSGVTRNYLLFPMALGEYRLPRQAIGITYQNYETRQRETVEVMIDPQIFAAIRPPGTEDLDPFIAASELNLEQEIIGEPADMVPGSAVTRRVTATLAGAPAIFIPPLLNRERSDAIAAYPAEPIVEERTNRGQMTGERTESVTYIAEAGGAQVLPPISIDWYNLRRGRVETATLEGVALTSTGPPPAPPPPNWQERLRTLLPWVIGLAIVLGLAALLWHQLRRVISNLKAWWQSSEIKAYQTARRALRTHDLYRSLRDLSLWRHHKEYQGAAEARIAVNAALLAPGRQAYGPNQAGSGQSGSWSSASRAQLMEREEGRKQNRKPDLPPLNL